MSEEKDLKKESVTKTTGQEEKTEVVEEKAPEKELESKEEKTEDLPQWAQDRLTKAESDKDNYKEGMLKYKSKTLEPEKKEAVKEEEEYPEWDDTSKKFQKQTISQAEGMAEKKAKEIVEKYNEKTAINSFISEHPELEKDTNWKEVVSNYSPKNGKETVDDVAKDLKRAYVLTRYEKGETIDEVDDTEQKADLANMSSISKKSSKTVKGSDALSSKASHIAERMKVDTKELAKEDDTPFAEIKL